MKLDIVFTSVLLFACGVAPTYADDNGASFVDEAPKQFRHTPPSESAVDSARVACEQDLHTVCHFPTETVVRDISEKDPFIHLANLMDSVFASQLAKDGYDSAFTFRNTFALLNDGNSPRTEQKILELSSSSTKSNESARRLAEVVRPCHGIRSLRPNGLNLHNRPLLFEAFSTSTYSHSHPSLKFGPANDHCLWNAFDNNRVSWHCGLALHKVRDSSLSSSENNDIKTTAILSKDGSKQSICVENSYYITSLAIVLVLISFATIYKQHLSAMRHHRRGFHNRGRYHRCNPERRHIKRKIMHAIYANPSIKAAVEDAVGEEIGETPLCKRHGFFDHDGLSSSSKCIKICDSFFFTLPLACLSILLLFTAVSAPYLVVTVGLPILILTTCYRVSKVCLCRSNCNASPVYPASPRGIHDKHQETMTGEEGSVVAYVGIPIQVV